MTPGARTPVLVVAAVLVQLTVLDQLRVEGASPDVALALAAAFGIVGGAERGAIVGFGAGLGVDLAASTPFGLVALTGCLVGFGVGTLEDSIVRTSRWLPVLVLAAAGAVGTVLFAVLGELLGREGAVTDDLMVRALVVGAWNGALAVVLVPLARWAALVPGPRAALR